MTIDLRGKRCFVTAAGQGIGRAIAVAMREAGASVIASDVSEQLLERLRVETVSTPSGSTSPTPPRSST